MDVLQDYVLSHSIYLYQEDGEENKMLCATEPRLWL